MYRCRCQWNSFERKGLAKFIRKYVPNYTRATIVEWNTWLFEHWVVKIVWYTLQKLLLVSEVISVQPLMFSSSPRCIVFHMGMGKPVVPTLWVAWVWVRYCIWYTRATPHTHTMVSWVLTGIFYNFLLIFMAFQMHFYYLCHMGIWRFRHKSFAA